jgi:hypothetical protein
MTNLQLGLLGNRYIIAHVSATIYNLEYSVKDIQPVTFGNGSDEHFHWLYILLTLNN